MQRFHRINPVPTIVSILVLHLCTAIASATELSDLCGDWRSANGSLIRLADNGRGRLVGRIVDLSADAHDAGYVLHEVVLDELGLEGAVLRGKILKRSKGNEGVAFELRQMVDATATVGEGPVTAMHMSHDRGHFVMTVVDGQVKEHQWVQDPGAPVTVTLTRAVPGQKRVRIVALTAGNRPLAIGDLFVVEVEVDADDVDSLPQEISVTTSVGGTVLTISATRTSKVPAHYESEIIEVVRRDRPGDWSNVRAAVDGVDAQVKTEGMTLDALLAYIEQLVEKATAASVALDAVVLAEQAADLAMASESPVVMQFAASLLDAAADKGHAPQVLHLLAARLMMMHNDDLDRKLTARLESLADEIPPSNWLTTTDVGKGKAERMSLALLRETAFISALEKLTQLNAYKRGDGVIAPYSFVAMPPAEALKQLRSLKPDQLDSFLHTSGVARNNPLRDSLRQQLVEAAKTKFSALDETTSRIERSRDAYRLYDQWGFATGEWGERHKRRTRREVSEGVADLERLLETHPMLIVKINDDNGAQVPLWRALGNAPSATAAQEYLDRAIARAENSVKQILGEILVMKDAGDLLALAGPKYRMLQEQAAALGNAPLAASLVATARGQYERVVANSAFWGMMADDVLLIGQVGGVLFPPVAYGATAIQVSRKGADTIVAYGEIDDAEAATNAGLAGTEAMANAAEHFRRQAGDLAFEVVFGMADITTLRSARSARSTIKGLPASASREDLFRSSRVLRAIEEARGKFAVEVANRDRLTKVHQRLTERTTQKIAAAEGELAAAQTRGEADRVKRLQAGLNELSQTLSYHQNRLASSQKKLRELTVRGPALQNDDPFRLAKQGQNVERSATTGFFDRVVRAFPKDVQMIEPGRYRVGPFEFRFKGRITDRAGIPLRQKRQVRLHHADGTSELVDNPHFGKQMEYDRIIIDHERRVIYLEDLVRTQDRTHMLKSAGYYDNLSIMFKDMLDNGYRLMDPTRRIDIVYSELKAPITAMTPDLRRYNVVQGKSYVVVE